jgi:nucleotide-binding universal stress UspA family protein
MRVLLAVDDSKFSEAALGMVVALNRPKETEVRVLHVVEPIEVLAYGAMPPLPAPDLSEFEKERMSQSQELVARAAERLRTAGFRVDTAVLSGNTRAAIVDSAAEWKADLIVVGSHGRSGLDRFLLGSVSDFVARHARCSVQIVRIPGGP